jgi:hypothetical protein
MRTSCSPWQGCLGMRADSQSRRSAPPRDQAPVTMIVATGWVWSASPPRRENRPPARARAHAREVDFRATLRGVSATTLCSARLRDGSSCQSVGTEAGLCSYHARLREQLGEEAVANGRHSRRRNSRERLPVAAESAPLELAPRPSRTPSAVRPALALTAAEEVETIRRVLLEAATSTTRETWATCTCPECGKGFRQEISVPDHGARIKAIETLLRERLGRVRETNIIEPKMPTSVDQVKALSWDELNLVFAMTYAAEIRAVVDKGDDALPL